MNGNVKYIFFVLFLAFQSCQNINSKSIEIAKTNEKCNAQLLSGLKYNFGQITSGTVLPYTIKIRNGGKCKLMLKEVLSSSAITSTFQNEIVLPDSTARVLISYNTRGKLGDQQEEISILTSASDIPLKVKFNVFLVLFPMR